MAINYTDFQNVALAISAYAEERWTKEKQLNSTALVTAAAEIDVKGESFIGQLRWFKPLDATVNNASLTDETDGAYTDIATDIASYIKSARTIGAKQVNLQNLISQKDGLSYFSANIAKSRSFDEHKAILSVLKGVASSEAAKAAGLTGFDDMPDATTGMYVDLNAEGEFGAAATGSVDARRLVSGGTGAARGEYLFRAMGMAWKDYEPEYLYMVTSPEIMADLRSANLIDETRVQDGNLSFQTIFGGKFRLLLTRAAQGDNSAATGVNAVSNKTTFLVKPGAISFHNMPISIPTEVDRAPASYQGGGSTNIWYRYGFVAHPIGYDWAGSTSTFATNTTLGAGASWVRKADPLNLSILPIFHA